MSYLVFSTPVAVATFNIQKLEGNPEKVAEIISRFDICGLQEVPGLAKIKKAVKDLENIEVLFDGCYFSYGNGIAFRKDRFRVTKTVTHVLRDKPNKKTAFKVTFELLHGGGPSFIVVVTHLDHKSEIDRLEEISNLIKILPPDVILLGDFNSLKRKDYSEKKWAVIAQSRKDTQWEECKTDVVDKILENVDPKLQDVLGDLGKPVGTCRFDTRIDYIFVSASDMFFVTETSVVESDDASDHKPVVATILITR